MPIGIHYLVSFLHECELRYGFVESFTKRAAEYAANGELAVVDSILPKHWIIEEKYLLDVPYDSPKFVAYRQGEFNRAMAISDKIDGCGVGKIMRFHVNNGYAYYVVTDITDQQVKLEWRGFGEERWTEPVLGYFGIMSLSRAEAIIKLEDEYRRKLDTEY